MKRAANRVAIHPTLIFPTPISSGSLNMTLETQVAPSAASSAPISADSLKAGVIERVFPIRIRLLQNPRTSSSESISKSLVFVPKGFNL